jgi:hypothetical protein
MSSDNLAPIPQNVKSKLGSNYAYNRGYSLRIQADRKRVLELLQRFNSIKQV